jgi:hypothetical protein
MKTQFPALIVIFFIDEQISDFVYEEMYDVIFVDLLRAVESNRTARFLYHFFRFHGSTPRGFFLLRLLQNNQFVQFVLHRRYGLKSVVDASEKLHGESPLSYGKYHHLNVFCIDAKNSLKKSLICDFLDGPLTDNFAIIVLEVLKVQKN